MSPDPTFDDLMARVRAGDGAAAAALVRQYEPAIRTAVRGRMADPRLRRLFDSADVCQNVFATFFARMALGQYRLDTPDDLVKLLATIARNKLLKQVTRHRRARRDYRRGTDPGPMEPAAGTPDPARQAATTDLLAAVFRGLSPDERRLVELRQQGLDWAAVAAEVGGSAEALRKQYARAVARVADQLDETGVGP
jgi:RNA polymerase sigma factor (sigma-70 family)